MKPIARRGSLNRWLFEGDDEEDVENSRQSGQNNIKEMLICAAPTPCVVSERRVSETPVSIDQVKLAEFLEKSMAKPSTPSPRELRRNSAPIAPVRRDSISAVSSTAQRRRSSTADPKIMWDRKLAESGEREKKALAQVTELQRKIISLEDRIRAIKNGQRRSTKKDCKSLPSNGLEDQIAQSVSKLLQGRECDAELQLKLVDAVSSAVARTLLAVAAPVPPPSRPPPKTPPVASQELANI